MASNKSYAMSYDQPYEDYEQFEEDPYSPVVTYPEQGQPNTTQPGPSGSVPPPSSGGDFWSNDDNIRADPYGFVKHHFSFMDPTTKNLELIYGALDARGVPVSWATNASGRSEDKFNIGNTMYDWIGDVGGKGASWWGGEVSNSGGGGGTPPPAPWGGSGPGSQTPIGAPPMPTWAPPELPVYGGGEDNWMDQGFQDLFQSSMDTLANPVSNAQFEALRQPIDKARRTANNAYAAELANRGMLTGSGEFANATGRNEERLAPAFATAVQNASVENSNAARQGALSALQGGNQNRAILGDLALRQLDQNRQWQQFITDFGLKREQVLELLQQGRIGQLLEYYRIWNEATAISAGGYIE